MSRPSRPLPGITGPGRRARWRRGVVRRLLSAALASAAVGLVVLELRPPPAPHVTVLVAGREVPAGAVLEAGDVGTRRVPSASVQPEALDDPAQAVGRRVGSRLVPGETVTASRLVPRNSREGLPSGRVALHVLTADPASVDLLVPGDDARVYPVAGGPALALRATVLAADPPPVDAAAFGSTPARGVVLALTPTEADAVLTGHGSLEGPLTVTVVAAPG